MADAILQQAGKDFSKIAWSRINDEERASRYAFAQMDI